MKNVIVLITLWTHRTSEPQRENGVMIALLGEAIYISDLFLGISTVICSSYIIWLAFCIFFNWPGFFFSSKCQRFEMSKTNFERANFVFSTLWFNTVSAFRGRRWDRSVIIFTVIVILIHSRESSFAFIWNGVCAFCILILTINTFAHNFNNQLERSIRIDYLRFWACLIHRMWREQTTWRSVCARATISETNNV